MEGDRSANNFFFLFHCLFSITWLYLMIYNLFSKSGRPPLKKLSDRKAFSRVSQTSAGGSPDCTGMLCLIHIVLNEAFLLETAHKDWDTFLIYVYKIVTNGYVT